MLELNKVYCMDCLDFLKQIDDNSVDLILTDPPYNIGKDFDNDNLSSEEYLKWVESWAKELVRICKVGGAIYLTLDWHYSSEIKCLFNNFKNLRLKNKIIWYREDGWKGDNGFAQSYEEVFYFIKDNYFVKDLQDFSRVIKETRLKAGYKTISSLMDKMGIYKKIKRSNGTEDYYSGIGFFESGKKQPSLQEMIKLNELLVLPERYQVAVEKIDKKMFKVFFNKVDNCNDVWLDIKSEKNRLGHPTQKPVKLFKRIIMASSNEGDLVVDCFAGSGTTAVACKESGRNYIISDNNKKYIDLTNKRLSQEILFAKTNKEVKE